MEAVAPLPFLVAPTTDQAVHEIILVHGFKNPLEKRTQAAKCRRVLESWILDAAKPIRNLVNVRIFVFDSAHILHHGHVALLETVTELSKRLEATTKEPTSPLSQRTENFPEAVFSSSSPSRAAVFVAHGIGAWVVKALLHVLSKSQTQIDPTGLIFLDVPNDLLRQSPLDLRADHFLLEYLRELSKIFKLDGDESRIRNLRDKLSEVDHAFRKLTDSRYGECESIDDSDVQSCTFNMKMWCENVWMSPQESKKTLFQKFGGLFPCGKRSKVKPSLPEPEKLQLEEKLREAISMDGFNDPISSLRPSSERSSHITRAISSLRSSYHTAIEEATIAPTEDGELERSSPKEEENSTPTGDPFENNPAFPDKEEGFEHYRAISRYLARSARAEKKMTAESSQVVVANIRGGEDSMDTSDPPPDWPLKNDKGKGKAVVSRRPSRTTLQGRESLETTHSDRQPNRKRTFDEDLSEDDDNDDDDEFYSFEKAVAERDAAVLLEDEEAMRLAQHRLDLVLWHQQERLGERHPRSLVTRRECIATSLVRGTRFAKPAAWWDKKDLLDIESQMRQVHAGLEESLGPLHRETVAALAALLGLRVALVRRGAIPWEAMELVLDVLRERLQLQQEGAGAGAEARTPDRLLHALRIKFKAGVALTRVWRYGEAMLEELLEETEGLVGKVDDDRESAEGLERLRWEVREKMEKLRRQREEEGSR
ncbi:hypothetical protein Hte_011860 [Hypoxylon texense]